MRALLRSEPEFIRFLPTAEFAGIHGEDRAPF